MDWVDQTEFQMKFTMHSHYMLDIHDLGMNEDAVAELTSADVYLQMGINVEARRISEDIGCIYPLREIPPDTNVTTYDGPQVDCRLLPPKDIRVLCLC